MEIAVVIINLNDERHRQYMNEHKVIFLLFYCVTSSSGKLPWKDWLSQKLPVNNFINTAKQAVKRERLLIDPWVMGICGLLSTVRWGRWWFADSYKSRVIIHTDGQQMSVNQLLPGCQWSYLCRSLWAQTDKSDQGLHHKHFCLQSCVYGTEACGLGHRAVCSGS